MARVLIVDDEPQLLRALSIDLRGRHYEVDTGRTDSADKIGALDRGADEAPVTGTAPAAGGTARADTVHLTRTEWNLLEVLLRHAGKLVESRQLLAQVWGPGYQRETNYLRFYLSRLRAKLEPEPSRSRHLLTEPGYGYRYRP
jgi:two-component system KDP operon response regulator KdpE